MSPPPPILVQLPCRRSLGDDDPRLAQQKSLIKLLAFFACLQKSHKIRITLSSRKVQVLEKVCTEIIDRAKTKDLRAKGPVRLPTKTLTVTPRKTPCGEGSKTWDRFEMRIHKRLIECVFPRFTFAFLVPFLPLLMASFGGQNTG